MSAGGGLHISLNNSNSYYLSDHVSGDVYMTGSQFISNRARKGGGVSLMSSRQYKISSHFTFSSLFISENYAEEGGGMIYNGQIINIDNTKITLNYAKKKGGGGISVQIIASDMRILEKNTEIFDVNVIEMTMRMSIHFCDIIYFLYVLSSFCICCAQLFRKKAYSL